MPDVQTSYQPECAARIGIDWGDKKHAWALQAEGSSKVEEGELAHTPEAIEEWALEHYGVASPPAGWPSRWSNRAARWCSP